MIFLKKKNLDFFFGGGGGCSNLLFRVQLSCTPNFTFHAICKCLFKIGGRQVVWVAGYILVKIIPLFGLSSSDLLFGDPMRIWWCRVWQYQISLMAVNSLQKYVNWSLICRHNNSSLFLNTTWLMIGCYC